MTRILLSLFKSAQGMLLFSTQKSLIKYLRSARYGGGPQAQARHSEMHGQIVRLRHPPRCAANQQRVRTPAASFSDLPQGHQRLPLRLGRYSLRRHLLRYRNRHDARLERLCRHPHLPRRKLSARRLINPPAKGVSSYQAIAHCAVIRTIKRVSLCTLAFLVDVFLLHTQSF